MNEVYQEVMSQRRVENTEPEKKRAKKEPQRIFLEKAASVLTNGGDERGVDLLIEAFLAENERETFRASLKQGEKI